MWILLPSPGKAFVTLLFQCRHRVMGGLSIAAVGYEITDALESYLQQHNIPSGVPSFKKLLNGLESEISISISLVRLDDLDSRSRMFLCCCVDYRTRLYDCEELMAVTVPGQFMRIKELLSIKGDLRRDFAPKGTIFSYDSHGRTKVKEQGLAV